MDAQIIYIYHNCFCLHLGKLTLLFDYPDDCHLTKEMKDIVLSNIEDRQLYIFYSHSHQDHFNPKIQKLSQYAQKSYFIVSDDVPDLYPNSIPDESLIVEPEQTYSYQDIDIETLPSNDLGVAFLLSLQGINLYFGGDLANWLWPNLPEKGKEITESFFQECLDYLKQYHLHIAFSDVDKRLENFAGGLQFIKTLQPEVFVPMHTFGHTEWLEDFRRKINASAPGKIFYYQQTGDRITVSFG